jgi:site-specific recombinase XerD
MKNLESRIADYLVLESARCKPGTIACYRQSLKHFCGAIKIENLAALTAAHLNAYILALAARNLAPYTKVNHMLAVRKYLEWEFEEGSIAENLVCILDRKKLPPVPEYLPRPLSIENDLVLKNKLRDSKSPYALLFLLLRQTGMRISELINLPLDCVLTNHKSEKYLKVPLGKMNTERLVPLSKESIVIIGSIKASQPIRKKNHTPNRLIGIGGNAYAHLALHFKKIRGDLTDQGKPITFHRLRHTYATTLLTGGVSIVSLMKLLGHRRIEMTLRYAKVTPQHLRDEYLKAIAVLENQSLVTQKNTPNGAAGGYTPEDIVALLIKFLTKISTKDSRQLNLIRRLGRIHTDFANINFSQKFRISS